MPSRSEPISIWFFVGILLAFHGLVITAEGLYHLVVPPAREVVLAWLHADLWWGALLLAAGLFYSYHFAPRKHDHRTGTNPEGGPGRPEPEVR